MELFERGLSASRHARDDRCQRRGHRHRGGPRTVQAGDARDRPRRASARAPPTRWTKPARSSPSIGLPVIIRPAYILGGRGTGIAWTDEEFERLGADGLAASPISEILIEESIVGWKEYELEVMRDRADNCVIICSIENVDPMGVHTGDSITVAPVQTLTDVEYQQMRDAALPASGVSASRPAAPTSSSPSNRTTGAQVVIEMNPRVSRSSALASKATGFPIAKIAAKLAVGYTLDEIPNDITKTTPASFEPMHRLRGHEDPTLGVREAARHDRRPRARRCSRVGEVMAIGRTFTESLQKALRSLEQGRFGLNCDPARRTSTALADDDLLAAGADPDARPDPPGR